MKRKGSNLRGFDLIKYLGSEAQGIPAPFTAAELTVMSAGAEGLLMAIAVHPWKRWPRRAVIEASNAIIEYNRKRFPDSV